mmetsp:Transcript_52743/g.125582  ORF Transcript_52743/g.125582 Transcript_52743/m.125582 type:complete len:211 (+) Transcript_52743:244-876(+)
MMRGGLRTLVVVLLLACAAVCVVESGSVKCFHGLETTGDTWDLNRDSAYWNARVGSDKAAIPVNCTTYVGDDYDSCAIFCRQYLMIASGTLMWTCRRFCMSWAECNATSHLEFAICDGTRFRPEGNRELQRCEMKCSNISSGNLLPTCKTGGGGWCATVPGDIAVQPYQTEAMALARVDTNAATRPSLWGGSGALLVLAVAVVHSYALAL